MRLSRPRFTVRRLMVLALIAALILGGVEAWRRHRFWQRFRLGVIRIESGEQVLTRSPTPPGPGPEAGTRGSRRP